MFNFTDTTPKAFTTVAIEAVVVGLCLILFYQGVSMATQMLKVKENIFVTLFIAGALFHLVFEYTGINKWYVENYFL